MYLYLIIYTEEPLQEAQPIIDQTNSIIKYVFIAACPLIS